MTEQKKLSIHPEYDEKKGVFLGYVVKRGNSFLKDNDGNKILLSVQEANNKYFVSYQGEKWHLSAQEYELDEQAQLKFKPKIQNGHFQGYTILQYDEKEQKLVSRGTVGAQDVKYKRVENGLIDCIYEDRQQDGTCKTYFIAKMTQDEYDLLKHFS